MFLVSLREVEASERILTTKNLLKESTSVLNKDVQIKPKALCWISS